MFPAEANTPSLLNKTALYVKILHNSLFLQHLRLIAAIRKQAEFPFKCKVLVSQNGDKIEPKCWAGYLRKKKSRPLLHIGVLSNH